MFMTRIKYLLISSLISILILFACKKIDHHNELPSIITGDTSSVQLTSVIITGIITPNDAPIQISGHVWSSTNQEPGFSANEGKTSFNVTQPQNKIISKLTTLLPGKTYFIRGYVVSGTDTIYGNIIKFATAANNPAEISTGAVSNITVNSADIAATITSTGTTPVTQHGIVWSKANQNPTIADSFTVLGALAAPASYTTSLSNLRPGTIYYVRAYATNGAGTNYGNVVNFTTLSDSAPTVTTDSITNVAINSATAKGNILNIGSSTIIQYGHVWSSINSVPTINDSKTQLGSANAAIPFGSLLTGLTSNTLYYVRSYAVNTTGITYGAVLIFSTVAAANKPPAVTTGNFSALTATTATVAGGISDVGSSAVTQYGHVWSSVNNVPTTNDNQSKLGAANTPINFNSQLTGLSAGTIYYVRAYAVNNGGLSYGQIITFTTSSLINTVLRVTGGITNSITFSTAIAPGNITSIGNTPVTSYGHVWSSTNLSPTIADSKTNLGTTSAATPFNSSLTGLQPNTFYAVRAYAMDGGGVIYSLPDFFYTSKNDPANIVFFVPPPNVTDTTATFLGKITDIGSSPVTQYGLVWSSVNSLPTINDNKSDLGSASGPINFTYTLTGLSAFTGYYVRAYAINAAGIFYSGAYAFYTARHYTPPSITSGSISNISFTSATAAGTITNTNNASIIDYGHVWSSTNNLPTINDSKTQLGSSASAVSYSSSLTSLVPGTTYYVRAYATNIGGTSYGGPISFMTPAYVLPSVTTGDPFYQPPGLTNAIVDFPGTITSTGNTPIIQHGHVWSKINTTPTLADSVNQLGTSATGNYNSIFSTTVIPSGTYYVRAYATNSAGTSYGVAKTFTY